MDAEAFQKTVGATDAMMADLEAYRDMLRRGNEVMNLVGPATLPDFWNRHALDSAQLLSHAPQALTWADLGAGAGLPGVVLAVLLKETPGARVHLIDSLTKRCRFLSEVVEALSLPADVVNARAETVRLRVDVVTARACAPMERLLDFARPCLERGATGLFLKGEKAEDEISEARRRHVFEAGLFPSVSDPRGRIIHVRSFGRGA